MNQLETTEKLENLDAAEYQLAEFLHINAKPYGEPDQAQAHNKALLGDIRDRRQEIYKGLASEAV